tara:strand:- start:582 stop:1100 length:519 start_codon:yes stop_codon:yes gene_type:complete
MKLHHTQYKQNYVNYILDTINEEINGKPLINTKDKISYIFERFYNEYGWNIKQQGKSKAMTEWLSGLALNIVYTYSDIIKLAIEMGSIDENPSDKLQDKVCENYFNFMANIILSIEPSHAITKDNETIYFGNNKDCFSKLLDIQPFSTSYAVKHGGYSITSNNFYFDIYKTA